MRTMLAATIAVIAAYVELPTVKRDMSSCRGHGRKLPHSPFHRYASETKYDEIGTSARAMLKAISFGRAPL